MTVTVAVLLPPLLDDAGGFVAEDGGCRRGPEALHEVEVAVTDAGGGGLHQHLPRSGILERDIFDDERLFCLFEYCGLHGLNSSLSYVSGLAYSACCRPLAPKGGANGSGGA